MRAGSILVNALIRATPVFSLGYQEQKYIISMN